MNEATERIEEAWPRRFRRYPEYRDSGVEWLGEIPAHWEVGRADRRLAILKHPVDPREIRGQDVLHYSIPNVQQFGTGGVEPTATIDSSKTAIDRPLLLVSKLNPRKGTIALARPHQMLATLASSEFIAMEPRDCILEFARYFYLSVHVRLELSARVESATRSHQRCSPEDISKLPVYWPSISEQTAIAAFLDRETAKIDGLVARKERLIEFLQEKRTALITRVVTRGLDPDVPMKDSGVEWLGEIPAHWTMKRLWHLTPRDRQIMYGIVLPGPNVDMGVPIVKGGDVVATRLKLDALSKTTFEIESRYVRSRLQGGDLVYAIRGSIGEVEIVPDELEGANLTQDAARVAYTKATDGCWLLYALRSKVVFGQLEARAVGATIKGINIRDLKRALFPVPPKSEQIEIASFIDAEAGKIEKLSSKVHQAISHLREMRAALISAAVTGKIDVREEAS